MLNRKISFLSMLFLNSWTFFSFHWGFAFIYLSVVFTELTFLRFLIFSVVVSSEWLSVCKESSSEIQKLSINFSASTEVIM